jgi:DNA-binding XRE family transcriptional regulator
MPNVGTVLKEEIARLSRKEIRSQVDPTRKATAQHRREIWLLKRQVSTLEQQVKLLSSKVLGARLVPSSDAAAKSLRYSAKGLQSQRRRLGLSATDFGLLLGVSSQSIYNWEHETSHPRAEQLGKLAALRGIGKREAEARLLQLVAANGKSRV